MSNRNRIVKVLLIGVAISGVILIVTLPRIRMILGLSFASNLVLISKVCMFLSGLVIVGDIVGGKKIDDFGKNLGQLIDKIFPWINHLITQTKDDTDKSPWLLLYRLNIIFKIFLYLSPLGLYYFMFYDLPNLLSSRIYPGSLGQAPPSSRIYPGSLGQAPIDISRQGAGNVPKEITETSMLPDVETLRRRTFERRTVKRQTGLSEKQQQIIIFNVIYFCVSLLIIIFLIFRYKYGLEDLFSLAVQFVLLATLVVPISILIFSIIVKYIAELIKAFAWAIKFDNIRASCLIFFLIGSAIDFYLFFTQG